LCVAARRRRQTPVTPHAGPSTPTQGFFNPHVGQCVGALIARVTGGHQIEWRWVKGHAGDPGNERADTLANMGVEKALGRR